MELIFTIGQLISRMQGALEQDFVLRRLLSIEGEVSNCKYDHVRGHIYFSMKDEDGLLPCVMFASQRAGLSFPLVDGQKIVATGRVKLYGARGQYQLYVESIVQKGEGDQHAKYLALYTELKEMGMFDPMYKRPIPPFATKVGIVTAKGGAAIKDIQSVAQKRNPSVALFLYPARVQGELAAQSIVDGIEALDQFGVDVIIVGRGGGSKEDLWVFNERVVAEAVFHCNTPVISAVGHEVDFTIVDHVADLRVETPTAAAQKAVFSKEEVLTWIEQKRRRLEKDMSLTFLRQVERYKKYVLQLQQHSPAKDMAQKKEQLLALQEALNYSVEKRLQFEKNRWNRQENQLQIKMEQSLSLTKQQFASLAGRLEGTSPLKRLQGGYAFVEKDDDRPVRSISQVDVGEQLRIHVQDGCLYVTANRKEGEQKWNQ